MSTLELVLNMLAKATTTELSKVHEPKTFDNSVKIAQRGEKVAGDARKSIEKAHFHTFEYKCVFQALKAWFYAV